MCKARDKLFFFICLFNIGLFYLSLTSRITENLDRVITDSLFFGAIFYILWQRQNQIQFKQNLLSSLIGTSLITIVIIKSLTLFSFEDKLIFLIPFLMFLGFSLLTSGFYGIFQYKGELFLSGVLFFPEEVIGIFLEKLVSVTVLNAKVATYLLYYFGFNVTRENNHILLFIPEVGNFQAIVNYSCSGMPMIILLLKLAFLLIFLFPFSKKQIIFIPLLSILLGFTLGVIRVCILTLLIHQPTNFDYWHGDDGAQIFSTLAIMIFSLFAYWLVQKQGFLESH